MSGSKYVPKPKLTKSITVWLDEESARLLEQLKRDGYPHAEMVRDKIKELLREYGKAA